MRENIVEIPWDGAGAQKAAEIYQSLVANGESLDEFDCIIAGIILAHGEGTLLTQNVKHFERIEGLKIIEITARTKSADAGNEELDKHE